MKNNKIKELTMLVKNSDESALIFFKENNIFHPHPFKTFEFEIKENNIVKLSSYSILFILAIRNIDVNGNRELILELSKDHTFGITNSRNFFGIIYDLLFKKGEIVLLNEIMKNKEIGGKRIKIDLMKKVRKMVETKEKLKEF